MSARHLLTPYRSCTGTVFLCENDNIVFIQLKLDVWNTSKHDSQSQIGNTQIMQMGVKIFLGIFCVCSPQSDLTLLHWHALQSRPPGFDQEVKQHNCVAEKEAGNYTRQRETTWHFQAVYAVLRDNATSLLLTNLFVNYLVPETSRKKKKSGKRACCHLLTWSGTCFIQ